jgi:hypothetical protein
MWQGIEQSEIDETAGKFLHSLSCFSLCSSSFFSPPMASSNFSSSDPFTVAAI